MSQTIIHSEHHFSGVHRLNPFLCNLMSMYEIGNYKTNKTTIKQIGDKYFFKSLNILEPKLFKRVLS